MHRNSPSKQLKPSKNWTAGVQGRVMSSALTTWSGGPRRHPLAGRSPHHSNRSTGTWARTAHAHPGSARGDSSTPPGTFAHSPPPGRTATGTSGCTVSHTAGTPGPQDRPLLVKHMRERSIWSKSSWRKSCLKQTGKLGVKRCLLNLLSNGVLHHSSLTAALA